jgi:thioredoxin-like negative regulator of GroEL
LILQKVDADDSESEAIMSEYDIRSIPTMILLDFNGKQLALRVGEVSEIQLETWLAKHMADYYDEIEGPLK